MISQPIAIPFQFWFYNSCDILLPVYQTPPQDSGISRPPAFRCGADQRRDPEGAAIAGLGRDSLEESTPRGGNRARMDRPDDRSISRNPSLGAVDQHGIHEIRGPLMAGAVSFLTPATGLFRDFDVRRKLSSKQRLEAYLQFQDQAFKIIATELVSASRSPVDLVLFTAEDEQRFRDDYWFHCTLFREKSHHLIMNSQCNGSGVHNNSTTSVTAGDQSDLIDDYKKNKEARLRKLHYTRKYYAYRKVLLKLDISQFNNDLEKAVEWLKSSTGWSEMLEEDLRRGLESHMDFLKEQKISKSDQLSVPESENVALERINAELASELEKRLDTSDWALLMGHYFNRMKARNLARACSIQAQNAGVILVNQALPVREIGKEQVVSTSPEVFKFPFMKQAVKQQLVVCPIRGAEKLGRGVSRRWALFTLIPFATVATVGGLSYKR